MPTSSALDRLLYTQTEAARLIHPDLPPRTMERWRQSGTGPRFVRVGRHIGYTRDAIEDFIERQTRERTAGKSRARTTEGR